MILKTSLYIALTIFGLGLIYKISGWFRYSPGGGAKEFSTAQRIAAAIKGTALTILGPGILKLLKSLFLDVLLQRRILKENLLRWVMHICIFYGFILLLLMHALEDFITAKLFYNYYSTLNPYMCLRNIFGLMVIVGVGISIYRRHIQNTPRLNSNIMDVYTIAIVAAIIISGFLLEGAKITSYDVYKNDMYDEYLADEDEEIIEALESYWVENYGLVSPNYAPPFDEELLELGAEMNENCMDCHSSTRSAFISYGVAKAIKPVAVSLDEAGIHRIVWYIHIFACCIGLAYLPFSRMFHLITTPISLLVNAVMDNDKSDPANKATRQVLELDACTHCSTCSTRCSMGVSYEISGNINILPSEKLAAVRALTAGKRLGNREVQALQEGLYQCTNCLKCTDVCPAGINLQELWFNVREVVLRKGLPEMLTLSPLSYYRGLKIGETEQEGYEKPAMLAQEAVSEKCSSFDTKGGPIDLSLSDRQFEKYLGGSLQGNTFSNCFACTTCTTVCPVVANYEVPVDELDMVPHQIIHAAIGGLSDMVFRSGMLWRCLGCYQCQESCPQGVKVTDIFYELKNMTFSRVRNDSSEV